jgi:pimeloyl-ACP methyl ester carboxylesterase
VPEANNGDVVLHYEVFGDPAADPLLLVSGLGDQSIGWDDEWCERWAAAGFFLIRFDNRDTGLSTHFDGAPADLDGLLATLADGRTPVLVYTLGDMADDCCAVLDAAGVTRAHVLGISLGGFVVQRMAIDHPERMLSMTSVMSSTGDPDVGWPSEESATRLTIAAPTDREGWVQHQLDGFTVCGSPGAFDETRERRKYERQYDRSFDPDGRARQMMAAIADGSRSEELRNVRVPTLVMHGSHDTLIDPTGGERTAQVIPGSRLVIVDGQGHDTPEPFWDRWIAEVCALRDEVALRAV